MRAANNCTRTRCGAGPRCWSRRSRSSLRSCWCSSRHRCRRSFSVITEGEIMENNPVLDNEAGMTTAELLGNAALGVLALVVIWGLLQALGVDIVNSLRSALVH